MKQTHEGQALLVAVPAVPTFGPTVLGALGEVASEVAHADGPDLADLGGIDTTGECPGTPGLWVWEGSIAAHAAGDCFEGSWRAATAGDFARFGMAAPEVKP
jgi:hypothetical protein